MKANDIRRGFLDFFGERGHKVVPSASLVPEDPTLLFTVAGMVPFKPYFLGQKPIEFARAASCQRVVRTNDIENVGVTARHLTLFEMLGNFSFGDYFKEEAIRWAWELSTGVFGLDPGRIWVTVYREDDEAFGIWHDGVGVPAERIVRRGEEDNFWTMGVAGPGGPCSELFYDRGPAFGDVEGFQDGDRIMEFYNLVFTEKEVDDGLNVVGDLPRKNVDTGMGLERIAQILQEVPSAYETDVLRPVVGRAEDLAERAYGADGKADVSLRIMAEHARAAAFLIGDGVLPANEDRGYVLRRLIRRAVRHAKLLGVDEVVMPRLMDAVIETMREAYPELERNRAFIEQVATGEEEGFRNTLRHGLVMLESEIARARGGAVAEEGGTAEGRDARGGAVAEGAGGSAGSGGAKALPGDVAFKLHDTYGFPFELTLEIAGEAGLAIEREGFEALMEEQRRRAREARKEVSDDAEALRGVLAEHGASAFVGYERDAAEARIVGLVRAGAAVETVAEGDEVEVVLDATPFYPEGGGQVGDAGVLELDGARVEVLDTQRRLGDLIVHAARVTAGEAAVGARALARVDAERRAATMRSHTATHILHATLRGELGEHARQAGSLVEPGRLRFDFPHFERIPHEVLAKVEEAVNARLIGDDPVRPYETTMEEARNRGAIMLFEEKYGDVVRVVEIGDYSVELCGGIHVTRTSQVGAVKVLGEGSIGSNLRRVEALTGAEAIAEFRRSRALLEHVATLLRTTPQEAPARVEKLLAELKAAEAEIRKAQGAGQRERAGELAGKAERVGDTAVVVVHVPGLPVGELQKLAVAVREAVGGPAAVVLASAEDGRAGIVAALDKATVGRGVRARALIDQAARAIGGGAGGRDDVATGGGRNAAGIEEALRLARAAAGELLA